MRVLTKLLTEDPILNRLQDQWLEILNPMLRRIGLEGDTWHTVGATGEPRFEGTWVSYADVFAPQFTRVGLGNGSFLVSLRGLVKNGTLGTNAFTLPEGYRPSQRLLFPSVAVSAFARLDVFTTGAVMPVIGTSVDFSLTPAIFLAEGG